MVIMRDYKTYVEYRIDEKLYYETNALRVGLHLVNRTRGQTARSEAQGSRLEHDECPLYLAGKSLCGHL